MPPTNLGNAYFEKGMLGEAAGNYLRAIRIQPVLAEAHFNLGLVYQNQHKLDLAIEAYERALRLRPGWNLPRIKLAKIRGGSAGASSRQQVSRAASREAM